MTFEQFKSTGRDVEDMLEVARDGESRPGRVYAGHGFIESSMGHARGRWLLYLGHFEQISDDLESLERILYEYVVAEGILKSPDDHPI